MFENTQLDKSQYYSQVHVNYLDAQKYFVTAFIISFDKMHINNDYIVGSMALQLVKNYVPNKVKD